MTRKLTGRDRRRNFFFGVVNGAVFRMADVFIDTQMVFTWFLMQLGVSNVLIGLVTPIRFGASFLLQILFSGYLQRKPYKLPFYQAVSVFRCSVLMAFAITVALAPPQSPWLPAAFFTVLVIYSVGAGLVGIPFMDMVGKIIPPARRGAFFSQRMFWGGITAFIASLVVGYVLEEPDGLHFPLNAAALFGLATVFYALTALSWSMVKEPPGTAVVERIPWIDQVRQGIAALADDAPYRTYVLARAALTFAQWAGPFYIVYARTTLGMPAAMLGVYLGARTVASILSNLLWGPVSDRSGSRRLLTLSSAVGLLAPLTALIVGVLPQGAYVYTAVFVALGAYGAGAGIGVTNYLLDVAPPEARPLYLAFTNTLFGLLRFASVAGGFIVDQAGFTPLLVISGAFYALALILTLAMAEPRGRPATEAS